jgi:hypothetical protein
MTLHEVIDKVLNEYLEEKDEPFKKNNLAKILRNGLNEVVSDDLIGGNLISKGSAGQGFWATVPWIGIFDKDITTSAQKGFDIVYLFSPDMEDVYLSLNQGWTFFKNNFGKEASTHIEKVSSYWQNTLKARSSRMTPAPINLTRGLTGNTNLPKGYELGNILSVHYKKGNLPSNEQMLVDLKNMIFCLNELKNNLINSSDFYQNISYILSLNIDVKAPVTRSIIKKVSRKKTSINLVERKLTNIHSKFQGQKKDFNAINQNNSKIGFLGEQIVFETEKKKLANFPNLRNKVEHVSQTKGDGLGYDVLSFDEKGNKMYIEVKTTTKNQDTPFFISRNELDFSKTHGNEYYLYRIFNFEKLVNSNNVEFFKLKGDISKILSFTPVSYLSSFDKDIKLSNID